jgi:alpha,alpha-trehalase
MKDLTQTPSVSTPEPEIDAAFNHVLEYWPVLTRRGESLAFPLPGRFVKPGGFFKWFFYWDSYFTLLGLVVQGRWQLAREIVEGLLAEIEEFGLVPNYNGPQSLCRSRSQSPFNGGCETVPDTPHFRAISESGWDNTPRFGDDATRVIPVDLNCQLYRYELDLAEFSLFLGETEKANRWKVKASERRDLINRFLWDEPTGYYWDYDMRTAERLRGTVKSLASFVSLWAGVADQDKASRLAEHLSAFEYDHGLVACEQGRADETEHNYPTGWPYSHWYVCSGLRAYGFHDEASRIAMKWLRLIANDFQRIGAIRERHNVVNPLEPVPGRYPPQRGFAWTNGVFAALLVRGIFGIEPGWDLPESDVHSGFPKEWIGKEIQIRLPSYPWPDGVTLKQVAA